MKIKLLALFFFCFLLILAPKVSSQHTCLLCEGSGYIIDSVTGYGVYGATIMLCPSPRSDMPCYYTSSISGGYYVVSPLSNWFWPCESDIEWTVSKQYYTTYHEIETGYIVSYCGGYIKNITLIHPNPRGILKINLKDCYSNPVQGSRIMLAGSVKMTNSTGSVFYNVTPATNYVFAVLSANYLDYFQTNVTIKENETNEINVTLFQKMDCGFRFFNGSDIISGACEQCPPPYSSPLRIFNGLGTYGLILVNTTYYYASGFSINTDSGIKALRKL
jgi:hypothetical protein